MSSQPCLRVMDKTTSFTQKPLYRAIAPYHPIPASNARTDDVQEQPPVTTSDKPLQKKTLKGVKRSRPDDDVDDQVKADTRSAMVLYHGHPKRPRAIPTNKLDRLTEVVDYFLFARSFTQRMLYEAMESTFQLGLTYV